MLSLGYSPTLKFESLIVCELMSMHPRYAEETQRVLVKGAINRRDIWPSREEAYKTLKSRGVWKAWDDRVLRIFVVCVKNLSDSLILHLHSSHPVQQDGMRPLPSADYPDKTEGVTLKCSRIQEGVSHHLSAIHR